MPIHTPEHNLEKKVSNSSDAVVKDKKKKKAKSLLSRIMSFGARDVAAGKSKEKFLDRKKLKKFKFKR